MRQPPRRLSVDDDDDFVELRRNITVFVNGERMSRVLAYDIDEGFVTRIACDERGAILVENCEVVTEIVYGRVQVGMNDAALKCQK